MCISAYNISSKIGKREQCMRETRTTEFKEMITNTFLKTVSAFSNYDGGEIFFGIDDKGKKIRFEELPCKEQVLTFDTLCQKLKECIRIETFNQDTLKTLNFYNSTTGYNNAAGILADKNHFPGIDMVRFGKNISVIHKRATFDHISILEVYEKGSEVFKDSINTQ